MHRADNSMANIADIARIPYVLDNFTDAKVITINESDLDSGTYSYTNRDGTPAVMVQYSMPIDGTFYVVEAVPDSGRKSLAVVSAYIQNKKEGSHPAASSATSDDYQLTSETHAGYIKPSANTTIPQSTPEVNGGNVKNSVSGEDAKEAREYIDSLPEKAKFSVTAEEDAEYDKAVEDGDERYQAALVRIYCATEYLFSTV